MYKQSVTHYRASVQLYRVHHLALKFDCKHKIVRLTQVGILGQSKEIERSPWSKVQAACMQES